LLKKKSAPPPTGIDALPKAAAAALPKAAAAALEAPGAPAAPAAHPLLQKLMAGGAKGAEVTKLHLSLEMMPQDPQVGYGKSLMTCYDMIGSLGDLGMYCQAFDDIPIYSLLFPVTKGCTYFQLFESFPNFENMPEAGRNLRSVSGTDAGIARVIEFKDCIDLPLA
jgi:hypothetical protein